MLNKNTGTDIIAPSNPVMADCPPMKGAENMLRQSDKITALYCCLFCNDKLTGDGNSIVNQSYKSKKAWYNPEENSLCLRTPAKRLLTLIHGRGCRNYGRINAARRGQARQICFPGLCVVPIAVKNCTTAQVRPLKQGKTILSALHQGSKEKRFARHILSAPLTWNRGCLLTWDRRLPVSRTTKSNSVKL